MLSLFFLGGGGGGLGRIIGLWEEGILSGRGEEEGPGLFEEGECLGDEGLGRGGELVPALLLMESECVSLSGDRTNSPDSEGWRRL